MKAGAEYRLLKKKERRKTRLHPRRARRQTCTRNGAGCSLDVATAGEYGRCVFEQQVLSSKCDIYFLIFFCLDALRSAK